MRTHPAALIVRLLLFAALLSLGAMARLNAADPAKSTPASSAKPAAAELSPAEQQELGMAAIHWLNLLDAGKYVENFAAASKSFRKDLTAEAWAKNHASMQKQFGAVISRDDDVEFKTRTSQSDDGKETITYTLKIKTKFEKKDGVENVSMEKESGEWKVADYSIEIKL